MGVKSVWHQDLIASINDLGVSCQYLDNCNYDLLSLSTGNLVVHLISLKNKLLPENLVLLQEQFQSENIYLVHLWEDVWQTRKAQVLGRIVSLLGMNKRIHARKTSVVDVTQGQADNFMNENHLQGKARSKYRLALKYNEEIIAMACFSNLRFMKRIRPGYRSAEIIRFASLTGHTVAGGFSKLLKHFIVNFKPDDVMSYADRDWSLGKAYEQSGFKKEGTTPPSEIWLNLDTMVRYFPHRLPPEFEKGPKYLKIYNTGNLKYILYL